MIPGEFEYHAPKSIPDALGLLAQLGAEAKLLAGGHSLLPMMKMRFAQPAHLIDLGRIPDLRGIREEGATLRIGANMDCSTLRSLWSKPRRCNRPLSSPASCSCMRLLVASCCAMVAFSATRWRSMNTRVASSASQQRRASRSAAM